MSDISSILLVLAKLNPRILEISGVDPAPFITEMDVSHALGKVKIYESTLLGRVKWAGQEQFLPELINYLSSRFQEQHRSYRTPKPWKGKDPIRKLCKLALDEFCGSRLCNSCNGKGDFKDGSLLVTCEPCNGYGFISHKASRPWKFGVTEREWDRWEDYCTDILKDLDHLENHLIGSLMRTMQGRTFINDLEYKR